MTNAVRSLTAWLQASAGRVEAAIAELEAEFDSAPTYYSARQLDHEPVRDLPHWLPPVDTQDVWAAGVTYERSRAARQEEAVDGGDVYARVYLAQRPELFFKAKAGWVVPPFGAVGIRRDAVWNVPEPELALVANPALEIVGYTAGNDMSSRDIEGENPLYLPQAKIYTGSCALGPGIVLHPMAETWPQVGIALKIERNGALAFAGETSTRLIRRRPDELLAYLGRSLAFPEGVVLLTGAGIVPPEGFTLASGDRVTVTVDGVGALVNIVTDV
ncbi:MAG: fumarylacetoacetate hydrolase family protein [Anaerolineales bacterium]|nr:fumarylacetoacetate hydrolase family protein [Anaerolineales bacterium]